MYYIEKNLTRLRNGQFTFFLDPKELNEVKVSDLDKKIREKKKKTYEEVQIAIESLEFKQATEKVMTLKR